MKSKIEDGEMKSIKIDKMKFYPKSIESMLRKSVKDKKNSCPEKPEKSIIIRIYD